MQSKDYIPQRSLQLGVAPSLMRYEPTVATSGSCLQREGVPVLFHPTIAMLTQWWWASGTMRMWDGTAGRQEEPKIIITLWSSVSLTAWVLTEETKKLFYLV